MVVVNFHQVSQGFPIGNNEENQHTFPENLQKQKEKLPQTMQQLAALYSKEADEASRQFSGQNFEETPRIPI